jgi:hypothetical protein
MKKNELVALLKSVSVEELERAIPMKQEMERLQSRRAGLEKELASVVKQIESLGRLEPAGAKTSRRVPRKAAGRARGRIAQSSLASLVVEILREKKRPLGINEICDALLKEKGYRTRAKDFKAQVRVTVYKNDKGWFKKVKAGLFALSADPQPTGKAEKRPAGAAAKRSGAGATKKAGASARSRAGKAGASTVKKKGNQPAGKPAKRKKK